MIWTTTALTKTNAALITAAGSSQRFGEKKEYLAFGDNHSATVLSECLYTFISTGMFGQYIITVPHGDVEKAKASLFTDDRLKTLAGSLENAVHLVEGGTRRQESVPCRHPKGSALMNCCMRTAVQSMTGAVILMTAKFMLPTAALCIYAPDHGKIKKSPTAAIFRFSRNAANRAPRTNLIRNAHDTNWFRL